MPDISMCANIKCPLRKLCYRYRAIPSDFQSYADFKPVEKETSVVCNDFWSAEGRRIDNFDKTELRNKVFLKNKGLYNG